MKIIAGTLKGRNFYMPAHIKPTQNLTRKAIFDIIGHDLSGRHVLDLFSGSGGLGFEAFSSGAASVTLVEKDPKCVDVIRENMRILGLDTPEPDGRVCSLWPGDVFATIKSFSLQKRRFDLIFVDPPYDAGLAKKTLKTLGAYDILSPLSKVVVEFGKNEGLSYLEHDFVEVTQRNYGKSYLSIFSPKNP